MLPMILGAIALFALCMIVFTALFAMPFSIAFIGACMTVYVGFIFTALVA